MARSNSAVNIGINLVKVAAVYMVGGLSLGVVMGISQDFRLSSVHSHVLMVGWVTMAITGLVYIVLPACEENWLARVHFWGLNAGLPAMMVGLVLLTFGNAIGDKVIGPGAIVLLVSVLAFMLNVLLNTGRKRRES